MTRPFVATRGFRRAACLLALGLAAPGCTTWVKPGATEHERQATTARCEAASQTQVPRETVRVMVSPARTTPTERRCNTDSQGRQTCTTTGGDWQPPVYATRDVNESARRSVFRDCMFSFGWRPE